jgi:hypothetical protein
VTHDQNSTDPKPLNPQTGHSVLDQR